MVHPPPPAGDAEESGDGSGSGSGSGAGSGSAPGAVAKDHVADQSDQMPRESRKRARQK